MACSSFILQSFLPFLALQIVVLVAVSYTHLIIEFCDNSFYEEDYQSITSYFTEDFVSYEDTIKNMRKIIQDISF